MMRAHPKLSAALKLVQSGAVTVTENAGYKRLHGADDLIQAIVSAANEEPPLVSIKPKFGGPPATVTIDAIYQAAALLGVELPEAARPSDEKGGSDA